MMNDVSKNLIVGLVGWRGMVGSVLMERMVAENDFDGITPVFFQPVTQVAMPLLLQMLPQANYKMPTTLANWQNAM